MPQPNNWRRCRIAEVTEKTATWNPRNDLRENVRYVDVSGVSRDELRIVEETNYSATQAPSRARKIVKKGDTIVATVRPTLRRIAQVPASFDGEIVSTAFCVLRPDRGQITPDFLFFATQLDAVMSGIVALETGASYPAVRDSDVLKQLIPVPPLAEQREIVAVLNLTRSSLLHERECESAAVDLKRAAMRALFTRGLRDEAQKETEIGPVPESWLVEPLGAHHSVVSGGTPSRTNPAYWQGGEIPWVKTAEVDYYVISETEEHITQAGLNGSAAKLLPAGTLLLAMYGQGVTRARTAILGIEAACNQACAAMRPVDDIVDTKYLYHFLAYRYESIRQMAHGGQQQNLNLDIVRDLPVAFSLDEKEQREIVAVLDAIDRKIDLHRRKRAVLNDLFKAVLHKLMTGEIRVADLDLSALTPEQTAEVAA